MRISDWSSDVCSSDLFIGMGIAGLDIGALQLREMAAGGAGIARPGFDQPGIEIFGERAQDAETVRFGRVERQDEQHGIVSPLDGLVQHERRIARHDVGDAVLGELERVRGEREPMVAMAPGFGVAFLRVELARQGEALCRRFVEGNGIGGWAGREVRRCWIGWVSGRWVEMVSLAEVVGGAFLRGGLARHGESVSLLFVEGNAIAGYVGKEGSAARELFMYVHQGMDDEIDRR